MVADAAPGAELKTCPLLDAAVAMTCSLPPPHGSRKSAVKVLTFGAYCEHGNQKLYPLRKEVVFPWDRASSPMRSMQEPVLG